MKIRFRLENSIHHCKLLVTDVSGTRSITIPIVTEEEGAPKKIWSIEVEGDRFDMTVIPTPAKEDVNQELDSLEVKSLKEKLAVKATKWMFSALDRFTLRVACKYKFSGINDGDLFTISTEGFVSTSFVGREIFNLLPIAFTFFDISRDGKTIEPISAYGDNRREFLKAMKLLALADFGIELIVSYPFQVSRAKLLTNDKRILRKIHKYHKMTPEEREKAFDKI